MAKAQVATHGVKQSDGGVTDETQCAGGTVPEAGGQQLSLPPGTVFEPGNATLTFTPGDDELITEFSTGEHTATVLYWKREDGRDASRSFSWTFYVV